MAVSKVDYLERLLDGVERVSSGRPGGVSENRWLVNNYTGDMLQMTEKFLSSEDPEVRAEIVLLFGDVHERAVLSKVKDMQRSDCEKVRMACIGYLTAIQEDDELIPQLFDILDHREGPEFRKAASRMASVARKEDIPHLRTIYGQVRGEMRSDIKVVLDRVISRNPDLVPKRDLILSVPVYPDEIAFEKFLDSARDYLDVRYRKNILPVDKVSMGTFNNVARALNKFRTRLYNESDNLRYYGPDKADRMDELMELIRWANKDIATKEVVGESASRVHICPRCGGLMVSYKGFWTCPDCGNL